MSRERLELLYVSLFPPSPATFGAQRRVEGILTALSARHRVTCVSFLSPHLDRAVAERAMREYCAEVVFVPSRAEWGLGKRLLQLGSLFSRESSERRFFGSKVLQRTLDDLLVRRPYDVVTIEAPYLAGYRLRQAPPGAPVPRIVLDEHNIEHDLAKQSRDASQSPLRRLHHAVNWRKILREEIAAWTELDGVTFTSNDDAARARALVPGVRAAVIPNAANVDYFRPRSELPPPDGRTVLFFGTLNYFPNRDGVQYLLREIWPILERTHPGARLKLVGPHPTPEVVAQKGPRIEVAGLVDDLRPHLAEAAVVVVPLRTGGGTRFKILEAMAMGKPVVSTTLGAEGISATPGRDILLADDPPSFAAAVGRILDDSRLGAQLGQAARDLVVARYSWAAVARELETFLRGL